MNCVLGVLLSFLPLQEPATQQPEPPSQEAPEQQEQQPEPAEPQEQVEPEEQGEEASAQPRLSGPAGLPYGLRGSLDLKWIGRWTDGAHDNDLRGYSTVDFGDARHHLVSGHASGRFNLDMDRDRSPTHPFRTVDDTYSGDITARLYEAYADLNGVEDNPARRVVRRVRFGRQILYDTPETLFFDGVSAESAPIEEFLNLTLSGFVGVPNHIFEASPSRDLTAGGAASIYPWRGGSLRFDYMHVTDQYLGVENKDDLFGVSGYQKLGANLFARAHANFIESDARDFGAHVSWSLPEQDLTLTLRYNALFSDQRRRSIDFDYYSPIIGTYFAYHQFEVFGHKGLGDNLFVDGGAQLRELDEDGNESLFNHEFRRYYLTPGLTDWPWEGVTLTLNGEFWDAGGDRFTAFGGDVSQKFDERLTGTLGTYFQLYRYDVLADQEREDIQLYYAKLRYRATDYLALHARFEFEEGDDDFATVILGAQINF